jgi:hypothetical protein
MCGRQRTLQTPFPSKVPCSRCGNYSRIYPEIVALFVPDTDTAIVVLVDGNNVSEEERLTLLTMVGVKDKLVALRSVQNIPGSVGRDSGSVRFENPVFVR